MSIHLSGGPNYDYIVECRNYRGEIDLDKALEAKKNHPYLFSKEKYKLHDLCYYASYGQGRDDPTGPYGLDEFLTSCGVEARPITW